MTVHMCNTMCSYWLSYIYIQCISKTVITYTTCIQWTLIIASILGLCLQVVIWSGDVGDCLIWYVYTSVSLMTSLVISNLLMSDGDIPHLYWAMMHGDVM